MPAAAARTADRKSRTTWDRVRDKIKKAFDKKDEELLEEGMGDAEKCIEDAEEGAGVHIHNHMSPAGDKEKDEEEETMDTKDKAPAWFRDGMTTIADRLDAMDKRIKDVEEKEKEKKAEDAEREKKEGETEDNEKILGNLEMEAPPGTNDRARKARDSEFLADSFQETAAMAEILAPGIRVPTFDAKADPRKSFDTICGLRRTALDVAYVAPDTRVMIGNLIGGRTVDFKTMDCAEVRTMFRSVATMKASANNAANNRTSDSPLPGAGGGTGVRGKIKTIADLNAANRARYAAK